VFISTSFSWRNQVAFVGRRQRENRFISPDARPIYPRVRNDLDLAQDLFFRIRGLDNAAGYCGGRPHGETKRIADFLSGRKFTAQEIQDLQETVRVFRRLSWAELVQTICEHLSWVTPAGQYKLDSCAKALGRVEALGLVKLPSRRGYQECSGDPPGGGERSGGGDRRDGARGRTSDLGD
jgi:hypothetical protein